MMRGLLGDLGCGQHISESPAKITKATRVLRVNNAEMDLEIPRYPDTPCVSPSNVALAGTVKEDGSEGASIFRDPVR